MWLGCFKILYWTKGSLQSHTVTIAPVCSTLGKGPFSPHAFNASSKSKMSQNLKDVPTCTATMRLKMSCHYSSEPEYNVLDKAPFLF